MLVYQRVLYIVVRRPKLKSLTPKSTYDSAQLDWHPRLATVPPVPFHVLDHFLENPWKVGSVMRWIGHRHGTVYSKVVSCQLKIVF